MEKQYLFAIILLVILLVVVGLATGKFQEILQNPLQDKLDWSGECNYWAMSGCQMESGKVPPKLLAAVNKEDKNACSSLTCDDGNKEGCNCGSKKTDKDHPFCCASKNEIYATSDECGTCSEVNTNVNQVWYRCCQILISADLKSSCRCSN